MRCCSVTVFESLPAPPGGVRPRRRPTSDDPQVRPQRSNLSPPKPHPSSGCSAAAWRQTGRSPTRGRAAASRLTEMLTRPGSPHCSRSGARTPAVHARIRHRPILTRACVPVCAGTTERGASEPSDVSSITTVQEIASAIIAAASELCGDRPCHPSVVRAECNKSNPCVCAAMRTATANAMARRQPRVRAASTSSRPFGSRAQALWLLPAAR